MKPTTKRPRAPSPLPRSTSPTPQTVLDRAILALDTGLATLQAEVTAIAAGNSRDKGSRIASLAMRIAGVADAVRKIDAGRAKRLDEITPATVIAWFRELDPSERSGIVRELQHLDGNRSGLA